jgi:hypothetical protein
MPPRGGQANLTDAELRSAILYMYNPASASAKPSPGAAKPAPGRDRDPNHQTVDGIDVYLGFIPAQNLRALPKDSPELSMHGGIPKGSGYYHVNVSLYDADTRAPINDAEVQMQFDWPGLTGPSIELESMRLDGSYGNYVKPEPGTSYDVSLLIKRPGASGAVEANFKHKFE